MDDGTYSQSLKNRAVARRATQANAQALTERDAQLAHALPMADAAHAYCAAFGFGAGWADLRRLRDAMFAVHDATTPSEVPSSHVIVERAELERLKNADYRYSFLWDLFVDATGYEPSDSELGGA